jgi:hypothetical protein
MRQMQGIGDLGFRFRIMHTRLLAHFWTRTLRQALTLSERRTRPTRRPVPRVGRNNHQERKLTGNDQGLPRTDLYRLTIEVGDFG